jgi:hypothetical protein
MPDGTSITEQPGEEHERDVESPRAALEKWSMM